MLRVVVFENNLVILSRIARKMKKIKGTIIKHLGFEPVKQGDFIYHEGPLLSHFVDKNNPSDNYLYRWVDFNDDSHRWLIFRLSDTDLDAFFEIGPLSIKA